MSDGFPVSGDDQRPPALTSDTFNQCYNALLQLWHNEIFSHLSDPSDPYYRAAQTTFQNVTDDLNYWRQYALDGDLGMLPGKAQATWSDLDLIRQHLANDVGPLQTDANNLTEQWTGQAGVQASGYLQAMSTKLNAYTGTGAGNENPGCLIDQVGHLLKAAYTVQIALKKDLYQIAKATRDAINAIDSWGSSSTDIAMFTLVLASAALGGTGAIIGASEAFVAKVVSNFLGQVGGYVFSQATQTLNVGGGDVESIGRSMHDAVDKAVSNYQSAAQNVMNQMDWLWTELDHACSTLPPQPNVTQSVHPTGGTSFSSLDRAL